MVCRISRSITTTAEPPTEMIGRGLSCVSSEDLKALLRAVHRGRLEFPLRRSNLLILGMNQLADQGSSLVGLNERGVRAVIAVVMAERKAYAERTSA